MIRLLVVIAMLGVGMVAVGVNERRLATGAKTVPQTITCAKLAQSGPGDNAHVIMTDVLLVSDRFVYKAAKGSDRWETIWIPAIPADAEHAQAMVRALGPGASSLDKLMAHPSVIVKSSRIHTRADLAQWARSGKVQGLIVNNVETLSGEEYDLLQRSYGFLGNVWLLEDGRTPSTGVETYALILLGAALIGGAGYKGFAVWRKDRAAGPVITVFGPK